MEPVFRVGRGSGGRGPRPVNAEHCFPQVSARAACVPRRHGEYGPCGSPFRGGARGPGARAGGLDRLWRGSVPAAYFPFILFFFSLQPRKIEEIKDFLLTARRKDAKCKWSPCSASRAHGRWPLGPAGRVGPLNAGLPVVRPLRNTSVNGAPRAGEAP